MQEAWFQLKTQFYLIHIIAQCLCTQSNISLNLVVLIQLHTTNLAKEKIAEKLYNLFFLLGHNLPEDRREWNRQKIRRTQKTKESFVFIESDIEKKTFEVKLKTLFFEIFNNLQRSFKGTRNCDEASHAMIA